MDNLLHFIKSTKSLLAETLDLCNILENDMESDKMNIEKIEECLNCAKHKFNQIESIIPDVKNIKIKLPSKSKKNLCVKTKLHEPITDITSSMKVILFDIVDKIVESHEVVEILDDDVETQDLPKNKRSKTVKQSNIFTILDQDNMCNNNNEASELKIVVSGCVRLSDNSLEKTLNESCESEKQLIVDELFLQSNAAKETIIIDSDTESESVKESNSLIKDCSVVLYDISKLSPNLKLDENQNSKRLEKEINRLCRIPKSITVKRNRNRNEKSKTKKRISTIHQVLVSSSSSSTSSECSVD